MFVLGWIIMLGLIFGGMVIGTILSMRWGRGAQEQMSTNMESESASYTNYGRGPFVS